MDFRFDEDFIYPFIWIGFLSGEFGDLFINGQYQQTDDDEQIQVNLNPFLSIFISFL